jgi:hypothetical protein
MVALTFINKTSKTKFKGTFFSDSTEYEYTLYLLPIKKGKKEYNEIVNYFGNRIFKEEICLNVDEEVIKDYLDNQDVSAFIMVNPVGVDNIASGTLQIYDWCNTSSASSPKSQNMDDADVWINDVCRISRDGNFGNPLKALFYFMEQLVVQNLGKTNIKLIVENDHDITNDRSNVNVLTAKYDFLGFKNTTIINPEICPNWEGDDIVMEKIGLKEKPDIIDFNFLKSSQTRTATTRNTIVGGNTKRNKKKRCKKNKLTKRK